MQKVNTFQNNKSITPAFIDGGGEMGELIRSFDWSTTSLGKPETWPQSLRIAVRIMLDCPFGMYIAWGTEYIQMYNDGFRPILGTTKHPQALGLSTRKTFAEIWSTIGTMFDDVMQGTPVGFSDFILNLDRNGFIEECVFDFSYSPLRLENGEVGGVLVTVVETTEKVKAAKALKESEQQLQFAIEATELGIWDLDPASKKFKSNSRLKEWFGLEHYEEIEFPLAIAVISDSDRDRVKAAIETALQYTSGGNYDIEYTIIHPKTKIERIIRAKGRASFNDEHIAYRFNGTLQDITKETMARRLLTSNEQNLSNERQVLYSSFMNAPAGIAILNGPTHIFEFANVFYEKIVGRKVVIGKTVREIFPEIEQQGLWHIIENVYATGENYIANELKVDLNKKNDGNFETCYFNLVVQPLKDSKEITERLLVHVVDVTQQVESRKQIEISEKQFRIFADSIQNLAWTANAEGWIIWYNQQWYTYTGSNFEDMQGYGWAKVHHPDYVEKIVEFITEAWKKGEPWELTFPLRRHDGVYNWFLTRTYPVKDENGNIERWIGTNTDITEQKNFTEELEIKVKERTKELHIQNETFKQAEESSKQGSYSFNLTTGKLVYSDNLYRLIEYHPNEFEPSLEEFYTHVHPEDKDLVEKAAEKVLVSQQGDEWHYRMITKYNKVIYIKGTGRIIEFGKEKLLVGTLQDVTDDILKAKTLKEKNIQLQISNAEFASFSYIASHDLQEPLRKIKTFSKYIIDAEKFSDKTQDYFNRIIGASDRMQNLIISLLDFSRTTSTKLNFEPCDFNDLVEEVKENLQLTIIEKQAVVEYSLLPIINASHFQMVQLFTNLIDNAIKYSLPERKPHIKITSRIEEGKKIEHPESDIQKDYYKIVIEDNGIGFKKEYEKKIFELFQRLHGKSEYSGTGIGLAIVKKIVTNHQGFIVAEGRDELGATFIIYLPTS